MNNNNVASSTPPVCSKIVLCGTLHVIKTTQLEDEKKDTTLSERFQSPI